MNCLENSGLSELSVLTSDEIDEISGAGKADGAGALALVAGIGAATFGSTWGAVAVGAAFASAPLAVIAMGGLAGYGLYRIMQK